MSTLDSGHCSPLMVPELFYTTLDCLRPASRSGERQALAALAQTSMAEAGFTRTAGPVLHESVFMSSLERGNGTSIITCIMICYLILLGQIPPTSELATIDRYSHRIRELTISEITSVHFCNARA